MRQCIIVRNYFEKFGTMDRLKNISPLWYLLKNLSLPPMNKYSKLILELCIENSNFAAFWLVKSSTNLFFLIFSLQPLYWKKGGRLLSSTGTFTRSPNFFIQWPSKQLIFGERFKQNISVLISKKNNGINMPGCFFSHQLLWTISYGTIFSSQIYQRWAQRWISLFFISCD